MIGLLMQLSIWMVAALTELFILAVVLTTKLAFAIGKGLWKGIQKARQRQMPKPGAPTAPSLPMPPGSLHRRRTPRPLRPRPWQ
jgi:hypothetical protein